ncbi:MAG: 8-amino-7-oxononanoate synthase [Verrucomicrobiota bacterium]
MRDPAEELRELHDADLLRQLTPFQSDALPHIIAPDGRQLLNFSSNDYLGLSQHPTLKAAAITATENHGTSSTASRLVCGTFHQHRELEQKIARLKQTDDALVFANGYTTALGTLTALLGKDDTIILDKLSHACLIDAAKLSGATIRVFPHNNLNRLEQLLQNTRAASKKNTRIIVATESVFSMDGDLCPLREIIALKDKHDALLLLDEAHALGLLGPSGLGLAEELDLQSQVDLQMGTLGKAAGSAGGYLAASQAFIDLLTNKARSFIYSTAPPPAQIAAASAALDLITSDEGQALRDSLQANIHHLAQQLPNPAGQPFKVLPRTAIQPFILGDNKRALATATHLRNHGLLVPAIRYPTVPKNTARLRITVSASHERQHLDRLLKHLLETLPRNHTP